MKKRTPIAVVGMACLFPGASDLNTFWQNIVNKVDTTVEVPSDRWIVEPDFYVSFRSHAGQSFFKAILSYP